MKRKIRYILNLKLRNFYQLCSKTHFFRAHMKEKFGTDLRECKDKFSGDELKKALHNMRRRLDDPNIISANVVSAMLIAFRY